MRTTINLVLVAAMMFCLQLAPSIAKGQTPAFLADMQQILDDYSAVGLSVVVVKGDDVVYQGNFGYKDLEAKTPLQQDDIFRIASISKSFSAIAILQLQEQGKLNLDDDVSQFLPFAVRNPKHPNIPITLNMLLTHTSSLNDKESYSNLDVINPKTNEDFENAYNSYAPGEKYQYCNLNFNMLGAVIERVSGQRFDEYIRKHILHPLNLYGGYNVDSLDSRRLVPLYTHNAENGTFTLSKAAYTPPQAEWFANYRIGYDAPRFSPTGGMKISALDLARYMKMHMHNGISPENGARVMSSASAQFMHSKLVNIDEAAGYGLAIRISDSMIPGVRMTGHTGSAYGLFSSMFFNKDLDFGFVVITNGARRATINDMNGILVDVNRCLYKHFIANANGGAQDE